MNIVVARKCTFRETRKERRMVESVVGHAFSVSAVLPMGIL